MLSFYFENGCDFDTKAHSVLMINEWKLFIELTDFSLSHLDYTNQFFTFTKNEISKECMQVYTFGWIPFLEMLQYRVCTGEK